MKTFITLTKRNVKMFFKDKGMFFVSLITPAILLVLYVTFLGNVYRDSFVQSIGGVLASSDKLVKGTVAGQLISSLLAVVPVTVAFNSNMRMVQDKVSGVSKDLAVTPVKKYIVALSYFAGTLFSTLIMCYVALALGLIYVAIAGWFMSFADVVLLAVDVFLLALFGTALSSLISIFLTSQGQMSAIGTIISAGYGFVCGAYMPLSQFSSGVRNTIMMLPGTYGTSLIRNDCMAGAFREMQARGFSSQVVDSMKTAVDCNLTFFDHQVPTWTMYLVMVASVLVLAGAYVLVVMLRKKRI